MSTGQEVTIVTVQALERIVERGQVWPRLTEKHGVASPEPDQHRKRVHLDADLQLDPLFTAVVVHEPP